MNLRFLSLLLNNFSAKCPLLRLLASFRHGNNDFYLVGRFICARLFACIILYWSKGVVFRQKSNVADRGFVWWTDVAILICHSLKIEHFRIRFSRSDNPWFKDDRPNCPNLLFCKGISTPKGSISNSCRHISLELVLMFWNETEQNSRGTFSTDAKIAKATICFHFKLRALIGPALNLTF